MNNMYRFKYPSIIGISLTNRCNLKCKHCLMSSNTTNIDFNYNKIIELIDYMSERNIKCLDLTGGEPTMYPYIHEIVTYAKKKNVNISMVTNGSYLTVQECKKFILEGIYSIRVSLDGPNDSVHEYLRGKGSYQKAINGIINLLSCGYKPKIQMVIHKKNYDFLDEMVDMLENLGIERLTIMPFFPIGRGEYVSGLFINKNQWKKIIEDTNSKYLNRKISVEVDCPIQALYSDRGMNCIVGKQIMVIRENGDCIPCSSMNYVIGNIYSNSVEEIWASNIMDEINNHDLLKGKCAKCHVKERCGGGCRALAYEMKGDFLCPDPLCWI